MKREVVNSAAWLAGAGVTGIIGYLIATASASGVHPSWPYLVFAVVTVVGLCVYVSNRHERRSRHSNEIVVYSSEKSSLLGHDFTGKGSQLWDGREHVGGRARGELNFVGEKREIINLIRTNNDGKYQLGLRRYDYRGRSSDVLPGDLAISGKRRLRVSGEVKVVGGPHRLVLRWNPPEDGYRLAEKEILVVSDSWSPFDEYFQVDPARDCYLRIDDHYQAGTTPSALQVRRIIVTEEIAEK